MVMKSSSTKKGELDRQCDGAMCLLAWRVLNDDDNDDYT